MILLFITLAWSHELHLRQCRGWQVAEYHVGNASKPPFNISQIRSDEPMMEKYWTCNHNPVSNWQRNWQNFSGNLTEPKLYFRLGIDRYVNTAARNFYGCCRMSPQQKTCTIYFHDGEFEKCIVSQPI